jgi:hypothetical protein
MEDRSAPSAKQAAANTAWNATAPFAARTIQKLPLPQKVVTRVSNCEVRVE